MSAEPEKMMVGKSMPTTPIGIKDWKLTVELSDKSFDVDVCEWETANSLFPAAPAAGMNTPDWFDYWKKRQAWVKQTFDLDLTVSQVYQIFGYVRLAWNTIKPFFDQELGSAFGIEPTPGA
jgi:hypothetical protein